MTSVIYDDILSGGAIVTALGTTYSLSGSNVLAIPYANGMRVLLINTG